MDGSAILENNRAKPVESPAAALGQRLGTNHRLRPEHSTDMLANLLIFAFAVGLVVAYVVIAIKTVNESES